MKDELEWKITTGFVALFPKVDSYLIDDNDKRSIKHKKCVIKWKPKCTDYKNCVEVSNLKKKYFN